MTDLPSAQILLFCYVFLLVAAAIQDVLTLRIWNLFSVLVVIVCAVAAALVSPSDWWQHLLSFTIVLALGIFLFRIGWMGGGDAKLLAASAAAFDLLGLARFVPIVLAIGGVIALAVIIGRPLLPRRMQNRRTNVPYGVAIAIGAVAAALLFPALTVFAT